MKLHDIVTRHPVNKTAAVVTSTGEGYDCPKKIFTGDSVLPLPVKPITRLQANNADFVDLRDHRRGRLLVIGLSKNKAGKWVVRCDCGIYTLRTAKALKNENNNDCCEECRHLEYLKKHSNYLTKTRYK